MSDNVPPDVLTNIFRRLAVNDLVRCRRVSKHWLSTIDDPEFISSQLQRSLSTNSNLAILQGGETQTQTPLLYWKHAEEDDDNLSNPIPFRFQPAGKVSLMGSCHGLICFRKDAHPHNFTVINPSTGELHTFDSHQTEEEDEPPYRLVYGFGYDDLTADYKVVRIVTSAYGVSTTEIYSVRGKNFTTKHHLPVGVHLGNHQQIGAFAFGALHWCVSIEDTMVDVVLAFDLGSETFRQMRRPRYDYDPIGWDLTSVGVVDSCLCVCAMHEDDEQIDMWVMREYNEVESWSKVYSFQRSLVSDLVFYRSLIPVGSDGGGRVLLLSEGSRFFWCDPGEDGIEGIEMNLEEEDEDDDGCSYEAVSCVESLVKIFPNPLG